jgi:hypothetical protein
VDLMGLFYWLVDQARGWHQQRRRVRVLTHRAVFVGSQAEKMFIKVTNLSREREVEVTHIWFETDPPVHVVNPDRPLPVRLRLDETFETWVSMEALAIVPNVEQLGRVQLSSGTVLKSRLNRNVPPIGGIAGPGGR